MTRPVPHPGWAWRVPKTRSGPARKFTAEDWDSGRAQAEIARVRQEREGFDFDLDDNGGRSRAWKPDRKRRSGLEGLVLDRDRVETKEQRQDRRRAEAELQRGNPSRRYMI